MIWEIKQKLLFEIQFIYVVYYSAISFKSNNLINGKLKISGILHIKLQLKCTFGSSWWKSVAVTKNQIIYYDVSLISLSIYPDFLKNSMIFLFNYTCYNSSCRDTCDGLHVTVHFVLIKTGFSLYQYLTKPKLVSIIMHGKIMSNEIWLLDCNH